MLQSGLFARRAGCSEKQQPDKRQTEMSVSCPAVFVQKEECNRDLLNGKVKQIYFKCLSAAFGSALISSIYGIVDMAMVGQYQGPEGTAALAVVAPVWNIIYSLGLLMGIGGSVIFSTKRGSGSGDGSENQYFTASVIGSVVLSVLAWAGIIFFERPVLMFFGADESLLALAQEYMRPIPLNLMHTLQIYNQKVYRQK